MTDPRKIEYKPLSELQADPRNPKAHDTEVIDQSIGRFGVLDLIVQDQRTGYIVSGHGRHKVLTAMQERGESAPEGVKTDSNGNWLVPVVTGWASRTDQEAGAALIALNRTTELGGWADEELLDLLEELSDFDDGLIGVGYSDSDIEVLQESLNGLDGDSSEFNENDLLEIKKSDNYAEKWELVIECEDEEDQERKYQQLVSAGFTPKVLAL